MIILQVILMALMFLLAVGIAGALVFTLILIAAALKDHKDNEQKTEE